MDLVAQLRGSAAEREAAYARLLQLEAEHFLASGAASSASAKTAAAQLDEAQASPASQQSVADIAVACASPLCEVLCKPASEVGVAEHQRAWQVLTALTGVDPTRVGGETWKADRCNYWNAMMAPDSALGVSRQAMCRCL